MYEIMGADKWEPGGNPKPERSPGCHPGIRPRDQLGPPGLDPNRLAAQIQAGWGLVNNVGDVAGLPLG